MAEFFRRVEKKYIIDKNQYELIKKGIVSKRRIKAKLADVYEYLNKERDIPSANSQVGKELDYYFKFYNLHPTAYITYDREAYYAKNDIGFRITFDTNIQVRDYDLLLDKGIYGTRIFDEDKVLMEVKTLGGIPMWFVKMMSEYKIRQGNFSKYGATYLQIIKEKDKIGNDSKASQISNQILEKIQNKKFRIYKESVIGIA